MAESSANIPDWSESNEALQAMAARLAAADGPADEAGTWPEELWSIVVEAGATRWALPASAGAAACDRLTLLERYARVAEGSLTAAFILSQHDAAVRRLLVAAEQDTARAWIGAIAAGHAFTTVGLSQLTTSRRHGTQALIAHKTGAGRYQLDGVMPWVTGGERADIIVTGAVLRDGDAEGDVRQLLIAVPADRPGLSVRPPFLLAALQASCTSEVICDAVEVVESDLLAGPAPDVMAHANAAGTGGLETSALALGQARAALRALADEAPRRLDLAEPVEALADDWQEVWSSLLATARDAPGALASSQVRGQANALVLRITQAYLTARKGTGFLRAEPAQRWARQALFFLVWSCPGPVAQAAIRDLAGLCSV
jgi:alkylation response protein AidB-like acyl-CoA dehydrogenase